MLEGKNLKLTYSANISRMPFILSKNQPLKYIGINPEKRNLSGLIGYCYKKPYGLETEIAILYDMTLCIPNGICTLKTAQTHIKLICASILYSNGGYY